MCVPLTKSSLRGGFRLSHICLRVRVLLAILWNSAFNGYIFPFLFCLSLLFYSQLFVRLPQTTILPFCIYFSWGWSWSLPPVQCQKPLSIILQALCLSDLIPWIYLSLPLYNPEIWFRSQLNGPVVFPTFFNLSMNLPIKSSWSEPQSAPGLVFADCIELLHLWPQRWEYHLLKENGIPEHLTCLLRNLYAGQEATVRTGYGTTDWFQIGKGVRQGCILSPCLFNLYAEYITRNAGLEEAQAGIKI